MISQIPTPQRSNNKVVGEFYPLQKDELIALRQAKLSLFWNSRGKRNRNYKKKSFLK